MRVRFFGGLKVNMPSKTGDASARIVLWTKKSTVSDERIMTSAEGLSNGGAAFAGVLACVDELASIAASTGMMRDDGRPTRIGVLVRRIPLEVQRRYHRSWVTYREE